VLEPEPPPRRLLDRRTAPGAGGSGTRARSGRQAGSTGIDRTEPSMATQNELRALPDPACARATGRLQGALPVPLVNHSIRPSCSPRWSRRTADTNQGPTPMRSTCSRCARCTTSGSLPRAPASSGSGWPAPPKRPPPWSPTGSVRGHDPRVLDRRRSQDDPPRTRACPSSGASSTTSSSRSSGNQHEVHSRGSPASWRGAPRRCGTWRPGLPTGSAGRPLPDLLISGSPARSLPASRSTGRTRHGAAATADILHAERPRLAAVSSWPTRASAPNTCSSSTAS
jgi:hypothetical protein